MRHFPNLKLPDLFASLLRDENGLAITEFAFVAPVFLTLGLLGADTAYYVITHMRVSQVAMHVADNASRVGEHNVLVSRKVYESDINDVLIGAQRYADGLDLANNAKIIISSLELNDDDGQWIHWQRCLGGKNYTSGYGLADDGAVGTNFAGMGEPGAEIQATSGNAVMFVEVAFDYRSISPFSVLDGNEIIYTGSFNVRDSRDLTGIYQTNPAAPVASCQ